MTYIYIWNFKKCSKPTTSQWSSTKKNGCKSSQVVGPPPKKKPCVFTAFSASSLEKWCYATARCLDLHPDRWKLHTIPMGEKKVTKSPYNWEFRHLIKSKKTDSSVRLENAFRIESRMGKTHDKFSPMELRVSKLIWLSNIFSIGIINIQYHENVIKYHVVSRSEMSGGPSS